MRYAIYFKWADDGTEDTFISCSAEERDSDIKEMLNRETKDFSDISYCPIYSNGEYGKHIVVLEKGEKRRKSKKSGKLKKAKHIVKHFADVARCGMFDCRNLTGDELFTLCNEDGLQIDICYKYSYLEVFGLTNDEFDELSRYYHRLVARGKRGRK